MRTIEHFKAWLWLAGFEEKFIKENFDTYEYYGKPQLVLASKLTGFEWLKADDAYWCSSAGAPRLSDLSVEALITEAQRVLDDYLKEQLLWSCKKHSTQLRRT